MREAIRIHTEATGERPLGWYTGRTSPHTLKLVLDDGGFLYSSDSYADDLPYWVNGPKGPHLIIPYTLDANDMRFINPQGFSEGEAFFTYLRDAFAFLYEEGAVAPKMMSVGLHCRLAGRLCRRGVEAVPRSHRQVRPGADGRRDRALAPRTSRLRPMPVVA
jgi:peptidoglycan/xylan/chitin deacetylase (PgdA/CDA1 family)